MAAAALFLAAKVEEQPRKLEYVIRAANIVRNPKDTSFDINSERYQTQSQDLVFNENVLLQTLGFDVAIDHPHTHVVRCCHLVRASKDLAQTSYFMASNSLHLTTMCIQYKPTVVACFCILVACKWSNWEIPLSNEKKEWYSYVDPTVTAELLQQLTEEFLEIFENSPSRLKDLMATADNNPAQYTSSSASHTPSPFDQEPRKREENRSHEIRIGNEDLHKHRSRPHDSNSASSQQVSREQREREYREKKERERLAQQQHAQKSISTSSSGKPPGHGHHNRPIDPKLKPNAAPPQTQSYSRPPVSGAPHSRSVTEPRDVLRDKRDYLLKPNVLASNDYDRLSFSGEKPRIDPNRSKMPNTKPTHLSTSSSSLHDTNRHDNMQKPVYKSETEKKAAHLTSASVHEKMYKTNSTSQKLKSPLPGPPASADKSVLKTHPHPMQHSQIVQKPPHYNNGNSLPSMVDIKPDVNALHTEVRVKDEKNRDYRRDDRLNSDIKIKEEIKVKEEFKIKEEPKDEVSVPPVIKRPSLFSPEKTPPHKKQIKSSPKWFNESLNFTPKTESDNDVSGKRTRNYSSSGSDAELRPVMKKIDQVEGFENLMRDSSIGVNKFHQVPDIITPISDKKPPSNYVKDTKPPDVISTLGDGNSVVNGIETNPTLISNLLKETAPTISHLKVQPPAPPPTAAPLQPPPDPIEGQKHHKSKKKNKEKHKHKDKDKNREEKEKKKKHKDKDREKHKHKDKSEAGNGAVPAEPIKIKIHKDKLAVSESSSSSSSFAFKIKIPKDKLKTESMGETTSSSSGNNSGMPSGNVGIKIKIPKDVINNCNSVDVPLTTPSTGKKRERSSTPADGTPPNKMAKSSRDGKQNGRNSFKVSQNNYRQPKDMQFSHPPPPILHPRQTHQIPNNYQMYSHPPPPPPPSSSQHSAQNPMFFYPPPPPQQMPPQMASGGGTMPPYLYHHQPFYPTGYNMYQTADMYQPQSYSGHAGGNGTGGGGNPPLPIDAPPDVPPPPPPE